MFQSQTVKSFLVFLAALPVVAGSLTAPPAAASPEIWRNHGWQKTDFSKASVDLSEIAMAVMVASGSSSKDRIPAIDDPVFEPIGEIDNLEAAAPVVTVAIDGDARAYPLSVLIWHEIINDTVGGVPIAVTYCPLCNTALVFERSIDGLELDFGTSGMLRHSDLVMYDRQTDSWWQQYTGEAIVGAMTGARLAGVPARLESFALFKERYPDGRVLVPNDPNLRPYGRNPYVGYDTSDKPFLFRGKLREGIDPMERIVMVEVAGRAEAVTLERLRREGRIDLGEVTISWIPGQNSALDAARIGDGRDVGNVVVQRRTGGVTADIVHHVTFAFAFYAFNPDGKLHAD